MIGMTYFFDYFHIQTTISMNVRRFQILFLILTSTLFHTCQKIERVDPIVRSNEAQNIGVREVTLVGELQDMGARSDWDYGFIWSDQPGISINSGTQIYLGNRSELGLFSSFLEDLSRGTTYYFVSFVADPEYTRIYYGQERDFTTLQ